MLEMPEHEVKSMRARVKELAASDQIKDQIASILMDVDIGICGLYEPEAKYKAEELEKLFYRWFDEITK